MKTCVSFCCTYNSTFKKKDYVCNARRLLLYICIIVKTMHVVGKKDSGKKKIYRQTYTVIHTYYIQIFSTKKEFLDQYHSYYSWMCIMWLIHTKDATRSRMYSIYVFAYIYIHTHIFKHTSMGVTWLIHTNYVTYSRTYSIYVFTYIRIHTHIYKHTYKRTYTCTHTHIHIHTYMHTHIRIYIYTYTYAYQFVF